MNLGNGKQTYTVSGIMDVENDSRMFQLYVSEAFVEEIAQGEPPVSYTHLDVYKRQLQTRFDYVYTMMLGYGLVFLLPCLIGISRCV